MSIVKDDTTRSEAIDVAPELTLDDKTGNWHLGHQSAFQEQVNPFRRSFLQLYGCLFVAYLCAATNGYDANTFGEFKSLLS